MIQRYTLLTFMTLFAIMCMAQRDLHKEFILHTNGQLQFEENAKEFIKSPQISIGEQYAGSVFKLLQFNGTPTQKEREILEATGIKLLGYVPYHSYIAAIPTNYTWQQLAGYSLRSVNTLTAQLKTQKALVQEDYPDYALSGNDEIDLVITYYENLRHGDIFRQLSARYEILHHVKYTNHIKLRAPIDDISLLASMPFVSYVSTANDQPHPENLVGMSDHRSNSIKKDWVNNRNYDGSGINIMLQDDGMVGPHIDYEGRIGGQFTTANGGTEHGDHVGGTIMGAGNIDPTTEGMASGATMWVYKAAPEYSGFDSIWNDYGNLGIVITSTSYSDGCNAGYNQLAQNMDEQVRTFPSLMHVFSAGNSNNQDCGYGAGNQWGNITGGHKSGKNVIAVANLDYEDVVSSSSSRGPAFDGRIKPDVAGVGSNVYSTQPPNTYDFKSGTSMSCPGTSGTLGQLYDAYEEINGSLPEGGLMKAVLMNTADDIGNPGPDFIHGYGRINARRALDNLEMGWYLNNSITQAGNNTHNITVPANVAELRIMLYWTDWEATLMTTKALVNDLDLVVTDPAVTTYDPWVLDHTPNAVTLNNPAVRARDSLNNAEQVTIDSPAAGTYSIDVFGVDVPQGPQAYWIVYQFVMDDIVVTYPQGGENIDPTYDETIRWDAYTTTGTYDVEYSTDNGSSWIPIVTGLTGATRHYDWNIPIALTGEALVRVSNGALNDQSDTAFSIIGVPTNLQVNWACPDSFELQWNTVTGATAYEVSMLGAMYMDSMGTTTGNTFVFTGVNPVTSYWVSVKALGPTNAIGRRAIAIEKQPGTFGCAIPFDASVLIINGPLDGSIFQGCEDLNAVTVSIDVQNNGTTTISGVPVFYRVDGGPPVNEVYIGTLIASASGTHTFTTLADLSGAGAHVIDCWVEYPNDGNGWNDTLSITVEVLPSTMNVPPFAEDFETWGLCGTNNDCDLEVCAGANGWVNRGNVVQDDIDWRVNEGDTPSLTTGPSIDFDPGTTTGNYVYLEASGGCNFREAYLVSPCIDLTSAVLPEVSYAYHMDGTDMGELHVDVFDGTTWSNDIISPVIGNQGNNWNADTIDLSVYNGSIINLRFRGETGNGFESDIALDAINFVDNWVGVDETSIAASIKVYPNPSTGQFNIEISDLEGRSLSYQLFDATGRMLGEKSKVHAGQTYFGRLDATVYAPGIYHLRILIGDIPHYIRLIVE